MQGSRPTEKTARQSFSLVLLGTVLAGIGGYAVMWLVPFSIGAAAYTQFAIFWGFIFLVISALSGVQQEVTRASSIGDGSPPNAPGTAKATWQFAAVVSAAVFVVVAATSPLWSTIVFGEAGSIYVWPAATGSATYIFVAVFVGMFYGTKQWKTLFWFMILEGGSRLLATVVVLAVAPTQLMLAWATAIPYSLLILFGVWRTRKGELAGLVISSGPKVLAWNVARTILAASAMGTMISGFPLILGMSAANDPADEVGRFIIAATFTRAPLIVVALALQSYLIVQFQERGAGRNRLFLAIIAVVAAAAGLIAVFGWFFGPWMFEVIFPREIPPAAQLVVVLVLSSALLGGLCVSGAAVLSAGRHAVYALGWVTAATISIVLLNLDAPFYVRTVYALLAGPAAGLLTHTVALLSIRNTRNSATDSGIAEDVIPPRDIN